MGQWPEWMKIGVNTFRPHENSNTRMNKIYQAASARMFYIWGEVRMFLFYFFEK